MTTTLITETNYLHTRTTPLSLDSPARKVVYEKLTYNNILTTTSDHCAITKAQI